LQSGPRTTHALALELNQSVPVIARTCAIMEQNHDLIHSGPRKRYVWHLPANAPLVFHLPPPQLTPCTGITADDIDWMNHYRQQAAQRAAKVAS
jgi:hypothetical protein